MPKFFTLTNTICLLVGGFVVGTVIYVNTTTIHFGSDAPSAPAEAGAPAVQARSGNPLLKATQADVAEWFPGTCFAEIYMQDPSYNGGLIDGCIDKTAQEIKAQTGVALGASDFRTPEVISHFKSVYGAENPWRI